MRISTRNLHSLAVLILVASRFVLFAAETASYVRQVAPLIDPAKLATLGKRAANPRVQKYVALLANARNSGVNVTNVVAQAVAIVGMRGEAASLTMMAMI